MSKTPDSSKVSIRPLPPTGVASALRQAHFQKVLPPLTSAEYRMPLAQPSLPGWCFLPCRGRGCQDSGAQLAPSEVDSGAGGAGGAGTRHPQPLLPCPSDGFSPRRKGAADGPGAELSICYQKVRGRGRAQRKGGRRRVQQGGSRCWTCKWEQTELEELSAPFIKASPRLLPAFGEFCRDRQITVGLACSPGGHLIPGTGLSHRSKIPSSLANQTLELITAETYSLGSGRLNVLPGAKSALSLSLPAPCWP